MRVKQQEATLGLRIAIEGHWLAEEFSELFASVDYLYRIPVLIESTSKTSNDELEITVFSTSGVSIPSIVHPKDYYIEAEDWVLAKTSNMARKLQVRRVQYASPGSIDILGVGKALEHLKDLIISGFEVRHRLRMQKEEEREKKLKNDLLEIQRHSTLCKLVEEMRLPAATERAAKMGIVRRLRPLLDLHESGKITEVVDIIEEDEA